MLSTAGIFIVFDYLGQVKEENVAADEEAKKKINEERRSFAIARWAWYAAALGGLLWAASGVFTISFGENEEDEATAEAEAPKDEDDEGEAHEGGEGEEEADNWEDDGTE